MTGSRITVAALILCIAEPASAAQSESATVNTAVREFNVKDYGAKGDNSTIDTPAVAAAFLAANRVASKGLPAVVIFPPGIYVSCGPGINLRHAISVRGAGSYQSMIRIPDTCSGDLFAWDDVWYGSSFNSNPPKLDRLQVGVNIEGIGCFGDRNSEEQQNFLMFYDRVDALYVRDVTCEYLRGRFIFVGQLGATTQAFMRESNFDKIRCFHCGDHDAPVVEFSSIGGGDVTNTNKINQVDIYAPHGVGMWLHGAFGQGGLDGRQIRIEGLENGNVDTDLLLIGDSTSLASTNNIDLQQVSLINPYVGHAAIHLMASDRKFQSYQIKIQGGIGGGAPKGKGIVIDSGAARNVSFDLRGIHTLDTNVFIGANVGPIYLNGYGQESSWSWTVDVTSNKNINIASWQRRN